MRLADRGGAVLSGRTFAIELRTDLAAELDAGDLVVLDFSEVEAVSPSFADEIFGKFIDEVGEDRVRLVNMSQHVEMVRRIVRRNSPA